MSERNPIKLFTVLIVALILIIFIVFGVKQFTGNSSDEPNTTISETTTRGGYIGSISNKDKTTEKTIESTKEENTDESAEVTAESETIPPTTPSGVLTAYITISSKPTKTSYYLGDSFSISGLKVSAHYSNGQTKDVTSLVKVSKPDMNRSGKQLVTITYTEGNIKSEASFDINVTTPSISISKDNVTLVVGESVSLTAKATPSSVTVTWSSSATDIATVSSKGKVTAINESFAIITATFSYGGHTYNDTCVVTVNKKEPVSSTLNVYFESGYYEVYNNIGTLYDLEGSIKSNYDITYVEVGVYGLVYVNGTLQEIDQYVDFDFSGEHKKSISLADLGDSDGAVCDFDFVEGEEYIVYVYAEDSSGNSKFDYIYAEFEN